MIWLLPLRLVKALKKVPGSRVIILVIFLFTSNAIIGQDEETDSDKPVTEQAIGEDPPKEKKSLFSKLKFFGKNKDKGDSTQVSGDDEKLEGEEGAGGGGFLNNIFGNFTFGGSIGYGKTFYSHDLTGFAVQNRMDTLWIVDKDSLFQLKSPGHTEWVTKPVRADSIPTDPDSVFVSDSADISYKGSGRSIPLDFFVYYTIDRYRVGIGGTYEFHTIGTFTPSQAEDLLGTFRPAESKSRFTRFYVMAGAEIYSYYNYFLSADVKIGKYTLGKAFDKNLAKPSLFLNLGVNVEKRLSEILGLFLRPSVETKSYKMSLPGTDKVIKHRQPAFYIQGGATYRIPDLPKCPIKSCHTQIDHEHSGKRYRSRRHPVWEKQNPHYGENYPLLIKDKGKNKKRRNPY